MKDNKYFFNCYTFVHNTQQSNEGNLFGYFFWWFSCYYASYYYWTTSTTANFFFSLFLILKSVLRVG